MPTFIPLASDNFHRPNENPLNPVDWTQNTSSGLVNLAVLSDVCVCAPTTPIVSYGRQVYTGVSFPNDQYASATIGNNFGLESLVAVEIRNDPTDLTGYFFSIEGNGDGTYQLILSGESEITSTPHAAPQPGDVLTLAAIGTNILAYYNGVQIFSVTNTETASGSASLDIGFTATEGDTSVSLFVAGSVSNAADVNESHSVDCYVYAPKSILGGETNVVTTLGGVGNVVTTLGGIAQVE